MKAFQFFRNMGLFQNAVDSVSHSQAIGKRFYVDITRPFLLCVHEKLIDQFPDRSFANGRFHLLRMRLVMWRLNRSRWPAEMLHDRSANPVMLLNRLGNF